jgi:hypothetical protein
MRVNKEEIQATVKEVGNSELKDHSAQEARHTR